MEANPTFEKEFEDMKISQEVIKSYGLREEIKAIRREMLAEDKKNKPVPAPRPSSSFNVYIFRVAASLLLLIVAMAAFQFATLSGEKLYSEKAITYYTETTRGEQEQNTETQAVNDYQLENYAQYIASYEKWTAPSVKAHLPGW